MTNDPPVADVSFLTCLWSTCAGILIELTAHRGQDILGYGACRITYHIASLMTSCAHLLRHAANRSEAHVSQLRVPLLQGGTQSSLS